MFELIAPEKPLMRNGRRTGNSQKPKAWTVERLRQLSEQEPNTGCWLWTLWCDPGGYPFTTIAHKSVKAHRVAFYLKHGFFPGPGLVVMHRCDVRCCVNPDHLSVGTYRDNMQDALRKGRMAVGDRHWTRRGRK